MLKIENLSKHFGDVKALDTLNLSIESGEMVGIIGRSGAGKSTFLRLINRLLDPSRGRIDFNGRDIAALKGKDLLQWRVQCAMIFQQFNLVGRLDVLSNVLVGRLGYHKTLPTLLQLFSREEKAMAILALDRLDMAHTALQRAETLSGGQQQRVAIARALVQEPSFVLADEPIASLDPHNAAKVLDALKAINEENGLTVIANLHHLSTARTYCRRIIGMRSGRIVFDGPPDALTRQKVLEVYGSDTEDEEHSSALSDQPAPQEGDQASEWLMASG